MGRRRSFCLAGAAVLAVLALGLAAGYGPTLVFTLALAVPASDPWLLRLSVEPARDAVTIPAIGRTLDADLYRPAAPRRALVLVHGLSRSGRRHPDLARLALLLARRGQVVLVPELPGLTAFRLTGGETDEIRRVLRHLAASPAAAGLPLGVAGFSFGAGPALLAAADVPEVTLAGSFGGYADLRHVIRYVTTGVHRFDDQRYVRAQEEYNRWKLLSLLAGLVEEPDDRTRLDAIAAQKLGRPADPTADLEASLGPEARPVLALVLNRDEAAVDSLLAQLRPRARETLDALSPLPVVRRIPGRLLIAHGADDDSIPFTESLRLGDAAGPRARVVVLETFHHTGPRSLWRSLGPRLRDAWGLLRLAHDLLGAL
jgi:hypothetical protein